MAQVACPILPRSKRIVPRDTYNSKGLPGSLGGMQPPRRQSQLHPSGAKFCLLGGTPGVWMQTGIRRDSCWGFTWALLPRAVNLFSSTSIRLVKTTTTTTVAPDSLCLTHLIPFIAQPCSNIQAYSHQFPGSFYQD